MRRDKDHADFVDRFTQFAMRGTSRRGFFKWLGKTGLAFTVGAIGGLDLLQRVVLAKPDQVPCSYYFPGCTGDCYCNESCCQDMDNGKTFCCHGSCGRCVSNFVYVDVFWYWDGSKCVQSYDCIPCIP